MKGTLKVDKPIISKVISPSAMQLENDRWKRKEKKKEDHIIQHNKLQWAMHGGEKIQMVRFCNLVYVSYPFFDLSNNLPQKLCVVVWRNLGMMSLVFLIEIFMLGQAL